MSNYSQITDFSAKDALASGNPSKIIYGSDIDAELSAISTAITSKLDDSSGTLTTLDSGDSLFAYDLSAASTKKITFQNKLDQEYYLPSSSTATTSGTSKEISTGIPSNAKRITVMLSGVSITTAPDLIQLSIASGASYDITGFSGGFWDTNSGNGTYGGSAFEIVPYIGTAGQTFVGVWTLTRLDSTNHIWLCTGSVASTTATTYTAITTGRKTLTGAMDRLKITSGTTFDSGSFNIAVEI